MKKKIEIKTVAEITKESTQAMIDASLEIYTEKAGLKHFTASGLIAVALQTAYAEDCGCACRGCP